MAIIANNETQKGPRQKSFANSPTAYQQSEYEQGEHEKSVFGQDKALKDISSGSGRDIKPISRIPRNTSFVQSALFVTLFFAALILTVLGTLYSLSRDPRQAAQAYPILLFNLPLIGFLGLYLGLRVWQALFSKARQLSAPLLHRRFVLIFSLAALLPAILVGAFSTTLISRNINELFGENVRTNMTQARQFLNDYLSEQIQDLATNVRSAKTVIDNNNGLIGNRITYAANLQKLARTQGLDVIYVLNEHGHVLARAEGPSAPEFRIPSPDVFKELDLPGEMGFQSRDDIDFLIGLSRLENYENSYLYVGQFLKSRSPVLSSIFGIETASSQLDQYNTDQVLFNRIFLLTFLETALLILFAAIWLGVVLANRVVMPVARLVEAAEKVRDGDLSARVKVEGDWGEIADLGGAFNRMTQQLSSQRDDLVREHDISEQSRQFSEAVLSGVRAGVIGLTQEGRISVLNDSAERLLGLSSTRLVGSPIDEVLSEFSPAFIAARESIHATAEDQVNFESENGTRNFDLRVSAYKGLRSDTGWVLTFDDMTRLVTAQRHSAWREVARRIAHEIKNPLTPIQLSAERLQRKYRDADLKNPEVFQKCTDTILRQVSGLERMVDEFSAFARMPAPEFNDMRISELLDGILFAQGVAYPEVEFKLINNADDDVGVLCDQRLITQAMTNIYKNAAESIGRRIALGGTEDDAGYIETRVDNLGDSIIVSVIDNGMGWPSADKERLLEPYVTTRETGTGLGLAIVKRIAEDHGGDLILCDRIDQKSGARLQLYLPTSEADAGLERNGLAQTSSNGLESTVDEI